VNQALLLVGLLGAVVAAAVVARRLRMPDPIAFLLVGVALAFVPGLPRPQANPQLLFLIVLPPLLFSGGWSTDWHEFKRNFGAISTLAVGLVIFTMVVVAVLAHKLAGFAWPAAFVLGAIVSPPDAVAAEAIFERMAVPRRIVAIVTGEGLVNDGTALVLYRFALAAAVSGVFSLAHASVAFVFNVIGGIACGLVIGATAELVLKFLARFELDDPTVSNVVMLVAPYAAYLPADAIGASGVLSAVTAGIYASQRSQAIFSAEERVIASAVWSVMLLILNGFVFLLIGFVLPVIVRSLHSLAADSAIAAGIAVAVIAVRLAWVFPVAWLRRQIPGVAARDPMPAPRSLFLIGWSGMRGIVSLAAALALPYTDAHGAPLAGRSEIIYVTLFVIVVTLLLHGLTLGPLIARMGVSETHMRQQDETAIRIKALEEAVRYLHSIEPTLDGPAELETAGRLLGEYERRISHLRGHVNEEDEQAEASDEIEADHRLQLAVLDAERREISRLRREGEIPDDAYHAIEYDLDLAALRLR